MKQTLDNKVILTEQSCQNRKVVKYVNSFTRGMMSPMNTEIYQHKSRDPVWLVDVTKRQHGKIFRDL